MATVSPARLVDKLNWYTTTRAHSVWDRFSTEDKEQMLAEDLAAGTRVSLVLGALITIGLLMSVFALAAVLLTQ